MKRLLSILLLTSFAAPARAYIDVTPTLGRLVKDSSNIVLLRVERVSREKRVILYRKVADLKGHSAGDPIRHQLTGGFHPREPAAILDWAEPGRLAVTFHDGKVSQTCIGRYWYECTARAAPWWKMTCGQAQLCFAYSGSARKLSEHVRALLQGKEVVITAVRYGADDDYWSACRKMVAARSLPVGPEFPQCRFKASLRMPGSIYAQARDRHHVWQPGAGDAADVPALVAALRSADIDACLDALDELARIGTAAQGAVPVLAASLHDARPLVRVHTAEALARIDPSHRETVPVLAGLLGDDAPVVRRAAAVSLRNLGSLAAAAVPALTEALADADPHVRAAAAEALGRIGPKAVAAVPVLTKLLTHPDPAVRGAAAEALGAVGAGARGAVRALVAMLNDNEETLRWTAAGALLRIDRKAAAAALPLWLGGLASTDSRTRWNALSSLDRLERDVRRRIPAAPLAQTLQDPDIGVRGRSARLLGDLGPAAESESAALTAALQDSDSWVRCAAAAALVKVQGRRAASVVPVLRDGVTDEFVEVRLDSLNALRALGPLARDAVPSLTRALRDTDGTVRLLAAEVLWRLRRDAAAVTPVLLKGLQDSDREVRLRAVGILRRLGADARPAASALLPLLDDEDSEVRQAGADALQKIDPELAARAQGPPEMEAEGLARSLVCWCLLGVAVAVPVVTGRQLARRRGA
jgi:HEAT repeat protein